MFQGDAMISRMHQPSYLQQLSCVLQGMEAAVRVLVPLLLPPPHMGLSGAQQVAFDASTMTASNDLPAVLMLSACTTARLFALLEAPGGWEVLTETVPGQQLLQAWLSLQATTNKDYTLICAQSAGTPYFGPLAGVHQSLMGRITGQLHAALAAQKATQQQQQKQQQQQQQPPRTAQLPDSQLVGVVLMQVARYHLHFAEELQAVGEAIEGAASASGGDGQPVAGTSARAKVVQVAKFFTTQDASPPESAVMTMAKQVQHESTLCVTFARYNTLVQDLLSALISLRDALIGSAGGLQTSSSQDMVQQLLPGQGAAASSSCGDQRQWCVLQQPDQQLGQQWAAVFEAWDAPLSDAIPLEQLLQGDARLLQTTVASAAMHMQEWQQFVEQATGTGAQGASAAGGSRRTRQTSKQRTQGRPVALPLPVENVLGAMKALEEALLRRGQLVSALIPSRYCCNNPGCSNMAGPSESFYLVRGRSCVCGGCVSRQQCDDGTGHTLAARYCCVACQKAAYGTHQMVCGRHGHMTTE